MRLALGLLLALASPALAVEALVERRQAGMTEMDDAMKALGAVRIGVLPYSPALVSRVVGVLEAGAEAMRLQFPPGSEGGKAAPLLWEDRARFDAMTDDLAAAVARLAAAEGEEAALEAAERVAATCVACHEPFRRR